MDLSWADEHIPAIVQAWYPGSRGGEAVARLLFGECSPEGKLPVTFYRSVEELPEFTDYSMKGRTYRYMEQEALYPLAMDCHIQSSVCQNLRLQFTKEIRCPKQESSERVQE